MSFKGRTHSSETKAHLSAKLKGRPAPKSAAHRETLRQVMRKSIEELSYFGWHRWQLNEFPKSGTCQSCGAIGKPNARNHVGTDWSYIGSDPRGWEPDHAKYLEECRKCNEKRKVRKRHAVAPQ